MLWYVIGGFILASVMFSAGYMVGSFMTAVKEL